jgi:hypothetical protein
VSPYDKSPILLVPRRIVRTLPWINYDDFFKMEFAAYLRAKRIRGRIGNERQYVSRSTDIDKEKVVQVTRAEIERVDRYVSAKEATASAAQPSLTYLNVSGTCPSRRQ